MAASRAGNEVLGVTDYLRTCSIVADPGNLDLGELRCRFRGTLYSQLTPKKLVVMVSNPLAPLAADGLYTVLKIDLYGDTRGNPWYMDLGCLNPTNPGVTSSLIPYLGNG